MKIPSLRHPLHAALLLVLCLTVARASASSAPVPGLSLAWQPASGDSLVLSVKVALPPGWYINSNAPLDSFLVPTRLEASAPGLAFGTPRWPAPVVEHSDAMAGNMSLFKQPFEIRVTAREKTAMAGRPGKRRPPSVPPEARATLHYQSCDGQMCWPPKSVTAELQNRIRFGE